jgi:Arc/MetJ-type ribon-helix-helix transcriptional regulator
VVQNRKRREGNVATTYLTKVALAAILLEWTDKEVQTFRFRNRSHAFEFALAKLIENDKKE